MSDALTVTVRLGPGLTDRAWRLYREAAASGVLGDEHTWSGFIRDLVLRAVIAAEENRAAHPLLTPHESR